MAKKKAPAKPDPHWAKKAVARMSDAEVRHWLNRLRDGLDGLIELAEQPRKPPRRAKR